MAIENVITPRRDEDIVTASKPTLRFIKFLEELSRSIKDTSVIVTATEGEVIQVSTGAYTVLNDKNYTILCNTATTISLPVSPFDKQQVNVKRLSGEVTVSGSGKLIDGEASWILTRLYTNFLIEYSNALNAWIII